MTRKMRERGCRSDVGPTADGEIGFIDEVSVY